MRRYLSILTRGGKAYNAYPFRILFTLLNSILIVAILTGIWSHFVEGDPTEFLRYFVISEFIILGTWVATSTENMYEQTLTQGWNYLFLKPVRLPLGFLAYGIGYNLIDLVVQVVAAYIVLGMTGFVPQLSQIILLPVVLIIIWLYDFVEGYMISGLSYYTYQLWGFNVVWNTFSDVFGGGMVPLWVFPTWAQNMLNYLPFPFRRYYLTMFLLSGDISYLVTGVMGMLFWGVFFGLIGYLLHTFGWKRFESQGG